MADDQTPPSRNYGDLLHHISKDLSPKGVGHENLELAVQNYRTFEKEKLPAFHERHITDSRAMYDSVKQHVSGHLSEHGDDHVNLKAGEHKDTLEEALYNALEDISRKHGIDIDSASGIFGDNFDDKLDWLATIYDQRTGAEQNEGMSAIVRLLRNFGPERKISEFYQILREETDQNGPKRARNAMRQRAYGSIFSDFEDHQLATYLHKQIGDSFKVTDPARFVQAAPRQFYDLLENIDSFEHERLSGVGLSKKASDYDKAA